MDNRATTVVDVAATLVFIQGAIAVLSTVEASVAILGGFGAAPPVLLTAASAVVLLWLSRGTRNRSRRARRALISVEVLYLIWAAIDLALAIFLAHRGLGLVSTVTRIALPYAVIRLLRRPSSRHEFGTANTASSTRMAQA